MRGSVEHPCRNIKEVETAIIGKTDCIIYMYGTIILTAEIARQVENRKIKLLAVAEAYLSPLQETVAPIIRETDLRNVKIAENTVVTIDLKELEAQLKEDLFKGHMNF